MKEKKWISFDLDINLFCGTVDTRKKWENIIKRYRDVGLDVEDIERVKIVERINAEHPKFSFNGRGVALADWAKENDIDISVLPKD